MKQGVIFDMDGVLIDSEAYFLQYRENFLRERGVETASKEILDYLGKTEEEIWEVLIPENTRLRKKMHTEYEEYRKNETIDFHDLINPYVFETLERLKEEGYKVAICSSSTRAEIDQFVQGVQVGHLIDCIVSCDDVEVSKPNPEIYLKAIEKLGGETYIAVEDSAVGIQAAKGAGLFTVAVQQDFSVNQTQADVVVEGVIDIFSYL